MIRKTVAVLVLLFAAGAATAQETALLPRQEAAATFDRALQLVESTMLTVPGLARAGEPLLENCRQARLSLQAAGNFEPGQTYTLLSNLEAYLTLGDALPKPVAIQEAGVRQWSELRTLVVRLDAHFRELLEVQNARLRTADRDNLARYAEDNAKLSPPDPKQPRVVFFGDSITDFWRLNEYFPESDFVNRGISGQITGEMLGRMRADVIDLQPKAVVILAGTNDISRGVAPETIRNNLTMMCELASLHRIKVIVASVLPIHDYNKAEDPRYERSPRRPLKTILELNDWIKEYCRLNRHAYLDYYSAMEDDNGFLKQELADDGLHPNAAGYRVMAPLVWEAIVQAAPPPRR